MKKIWLSLIIVLFIISYFSLPKKIYAVSQNMNNNQQNDVTEQFLIPLMEALENSDIAQMNELFVEEMIEKSDKKKHGYEDFFKMWDGRKWIDFEMISQAKRPAEGKVPSAIVYKYEIICENDTVKIEFSVVDSRKKLDEVVINLALQKTGTLQTWRQFNIAQWLFIGLTILEIVFSIYVAIVCIKNKPKLWGIWLIFILTIYGGIVFPSQLDPTLNFFIKTFTFPRILSYKDMMYQIRISVPIGAIIFFVRNWYGK